MQKSFQSPTTAFLIMNELIIAGRYSESLSLFNDHIQHISACNNTAVSKYKIKSQKQPLPYGLLRLVAECLLRMNTREAFDLVKNMLFLTSAKFNSYLNNTGIACCFLLAIQQVYIYSRCLFFRNTTQFYRF